MKDRAISATAVAFVLLAFSAVARAQTVKRPAALGSNVAATMDPAADLSGVWTPAPPDHPVDPALFGVGRKETIPPGSRSSRLSLPSGIRLIRCSLGQKRNSITTGTRKTRIIRDEMNWIHFSPSVLRTARQ